MDMEALQATELDELQKKHRFDKDAVIQRCMKLTQSTSNTELYVKYQAEKKSKLAKLDEEYGQREHEIRQRYQESNSLPVLHDRHMSETLDPPSSPSEKSEDDEESELHRVPSYTPKVEAEVRLESIKGLPATNATHLGPRSAPQKAEAVPG